MSRTLDSSPNALINKKILDRYLTLELPENKVQATYIWIDGTDQNIRCKDRTLEFVPKAVKGKHSISNFIQNIREFIEQISSGIVLRWIIFIINPTIKCYACVCVSSETFENLELMSKQNWARSEK